MVIAKNEQPHYRTRFSNGAQEAFADTTPDKGGAAAGFRPHELLEAALACCVNMSVRMCAERHAIPLDAVEIRVRLDRGSEGAVFRTEIEIHGSSLTPEHRAKLLEAARACPVRRTLSGPLRFEDGAEPQLAPQ
jgi:putative redox protein